MEKDPNESLIDKTNHLEEIEFYGDSNIATYDRKIPLFLIITYCLLPLWGIVIGYYYWNGSTGWLDRGHWKQLQVAANTTLPYENHNSSTQEANQT